MTTKIFRDSPTLPSWNAVVIMSSDMFTASIGQSQVCSPNLLAVITWNALFIAPTLLLALASLLCSRLLPKSVWGGGLLLGVVLTWLSFETGLVAFESNAAQIIAWRGASTALLLAVCGFLLNSRSNDEANSAAKRRSKLATIAISTAMILAAVVWVVEILTLSLRILEVTEVASLRFPSYVQEHYTFSFDGLVILGILWSCIALINLATTRRLLSSTLVWLTACIAVWISLLPLARHFENLPIASQALPSTVLGVALATSVLVAAMFAGAKRTDSDSQGNLPDGKSTASLAAEDATQLRRIGSSATAIALAICVVLCYQLSALLALGFSGWRLSATIGAASSCLAAYSIMRLIRHRWSVNLAEAFMGLLSLSLCLGFVAALPPQPQLLADRYAWLFSAIIAALSISSALIAGLSSGWLNRVLAGIEESSKRPARLCMKRFSFAMAALALVVSALLTAWPRLPGVATTDDTLPRFAAGVLANLTLLSASLWGSHRLRGIEFSVLSLLALASTSCFVLVRMWPFVSGTRVAY